MVVLRTRPLIPVSGVIEQPHNVTMQKHYELTYIVSIKYLDAELQQVMEAVSGYIKEFGGTVTSEQILGKLRLAFPIKFTHQGTYVVLEFDMEAENIKKLDDLIKLKAEILRHLTMSKKIRTAEEIKREKELQEKLRQEKEDELNDQEQKNKDRVKRDGVRKTVRRPSPATTKAPEAKVEVVVEKAPVEVKAEVKPVAKKKSEKAAMEDIDKKIDAILTEEIL